MKPTVFGPTGSTGGKIVRQALAAGHEVTAVARRPDAAVPADPRLRVVPGDVLDPASLLRGGVVGSDAVLSALGSRQMNLPTTVYSAGTAALLAAMRDAGVRRFVGATAVPAGPEDQKGALDRYLVHPLLHRFFGGRYDACAGWRSCWPPATATGRRSERPGSSTEHRRGRYQAFLRAFLGRLPPLPRPRLPRASAPPLSL